FMLASSRRKTGNEFIERLDRDEAPTADLDSLELPRGDKLVGAGAAEPELKRCLLDRQQAWHSLCATGLSVVHGGHVTTSSGSSEFSRGARHDGRHEEVLAKKSLDVYGVLGSFF